MVHYVFWLFSGGAPASQPASQGGGGRGGGFQSLRATQPRLGAAPYHAHEFECESLNAFICMRHAAFQVILHAL